MIFIIMEGSEEFSMFSAIKLITIIGKQILTKIENRSIFK